MLVRVSIDARRVFLVGTFAFSILEGVPIVPGAPHRSPRSPQPHGG